MSIALSPVCHGAAKPELTRVFDRLPFRFEENRGQAPVGNAFVGRSGNYQVMIGAEGPVMVFPSKDRQPLSLATVIRGGNPHARITGEKPESASVNYLIGNRPDKWMEHVARFGGVRYSEIYPSIDLIFYGAGRNVEFDFEVKPGGDPSRIKLSWRGAGKVDLDRGGDLLIDTQAGEVRWAKPVIYQMHGAVKTPIDGAFRLSKNKVASFELASYDPSATLVIDPAVSFATFLGGSANDSAKGIALDPSGNILVAGVSSSFSLPTTAGVAQPGYGGSTTNIITGDAFIASLNPAGTALNWLTYLGGNQDDLAFGIAIDGSGNSYVTGMTNSPNFPVKNAQNPTYLGAGGNRLNPMGDAFVAKLDSKGQLVYSTYFGGSADDWGMAIAADSAGNAFITGFTLSSNLPVGATSWQKGFRGSGGNLDYCSGCGPVFLGGDAFAAKFDTAGRLVWTTYIGGSKDDFGTSIAVDKSGSVYVAGGTLSSDFPVSTGAFQMKYGGQSDNQSQPHMHMGDGFVVKLDAAGANQLYGTYLGGSRDDAIFGMAVDSSGAAYVTGATLSSDFPVSPGAFQTAFQGPSAAPNVTGRPNFVYGDGFAAKLNPTGSALSYATYFGGTGDDAGQAIAVDSAGYAFIVGQTASKDFPVTSGASQSVYSGSGGENQAIGDAFLIQLDPAGAIQTYGSYMGGGNNDAAAGIVIDAAENAYIVGYTLSSNFPATKGSLQASFGGSNRLGVPYGDAFVAKITGLIPTGGPIISNNGVVPVYSSATTIQPGNWFSIYGNNLAAATTVWNGDFPSSLGGTTVTVNGKNAYLWFVSPGQINAQAPDDTATGTVPLAVTTAQGSATGTVRLGQASPSFLLLADARHATGIIITPSGGGSQGGGTYDLLGPSTTGAGFRAAKKGEAVAVYAVGLGPTNIPVAAGKVYTCPPTGCPTLSAPPVITLGGTSITAAFAGIVGAGLYQLNFTIPSTVGSGDLALVVTVNGVQTQPGIVIPVQ